jgi:hypothetical protein
MVPHDQQDWVFSGEGFAVMVVKEFVILHFMRKQSSKAVTSDTAVSW